MDKFTDKFTNKHGSYDRMYGDETQSCTSERKNTVLITYSNIIMQKKKESGHMRSIVS